MQPSASAITPTLYTKTTRLRATVQTARSLYKTASWARVALATHDLSKHVIPPQKQPALPQASSLFLAALITLLLALASDNLTKHHDAVAVHEGHAREALAILEGVADKRLLRLEAALSHLVGLQRVRVFHLLAARLFAHLPLQGRDAACSAAAAHEANRGVANLDLVRDVQHLDLRVELTSLAQGCVLLVDHHVAGARHVVLVEALDVQTDVVARIGKVHTLVVHLHGEDLARARVGRRVRGQEHNLLPGLHNALLHAARKHIPDALDLVNARDRHAHGRADRPLRHAAERVKHVVHGVHVDRLLAILDVLSLPPSHLVGLLKEVIAHPTRDGHDRRVFLDKVFFPAHFHQHAFHLVGNLIVAGLLVSCRVTIHFVDADANLLHTQQVDQAGMLASLALDLTSLVIPLCNGRREVTICRNHDERHIGLGGTCDHVFDEVTVSGCVDHS